MKTSLVTMAWVCGLAAAPAAMAGEAAIQKTDVGGATESLRVMRDAQTGALRMPTAAEIKAMEASSVKKGAPKPVQVQVAPNGTKSVRLPAEYLISIEATRDANGNITSHHQQHDMEHGASAALPTE
ncbi:post-PEP-CTERM-1 domain-containing protein [Nevskia ramosa]|uniref:post-PEP-CTERM-1 domain-containing protein n=1 Tax=Nevskia ramosa TaxID=64002 RepID=UPI0012EBE2C2|nr:hypothetical protein [Nevskia ramosa]